MDRDTIIYLAGIFGALLISSMVAAAGGAGGVLVGGLSVFALCAVVAFVIQWVVFVPSFLLQTEHYFDLTGSITFVTLTLLALALSGPLDLRSALIGVFIAIWALRLGTFLFNRVREAGSDRRFREMKKHFVQFLMTWTLQGSWVFVTSAAGLAAITSANRVPFDAFALLGALLWVAGFTIEVVSDQQKRTFRGQPGAQSEFIRSGLWAWSRHPNYFGEILLWVGIAIMALPVLSGWQWLVLISPVYVWLLLTRISGIPMLERRAEKMWGDDPEYQAYKRSTALLVPRPPAGRAG